MKVFKLNEGRVEEWGVETDNGYPWLWVNVAHRDGEVIGVVIYGGGIEYKLTWLELRALLKVLENYKI